MCDRRWMSKEIVELTAEMILNEQEFGAPMCTRPTAKELGQALLKANKLGLRVIKGGASGPNSTQLAKVLVNKLGL